MPLALARPVCTACWAPLPWAEMLDPTPGWPQSCVLSRGLEGVGGLGHKGPSTPPAQPWTVIATQRNKSRLEMPSGHQGLIANSFAASECHLAREGSPLDLVWGSGGGGFSFSS